MRRPLRAVVVLTVLAGCPADEACIEIDVTACTPTYEPTFDNVFSRTLEPGCGVAGGSCHAPEGAKGGLVLAEADEAHAALLDGRVVPGDPGCSLLVRRIESTDRAFKMPPGSRTLSAGDRCAIEQWIADGALR
jgi:hypothetical protein